MKVLGIETTCDETAFAVVEDGTTILSNCIETQEDLMALYGGTVPELACRRHVDLLAPLLKKTLDEAHLTLEEIDLIAVAAEPGLIGALLVGLNFAKGLSLGTGIPFVGVNHVEAHLVAAMMGKQVPLPAIGVVLSGGHTALVKIEEIGRYELIGETHDDAIGEAFDKVAKLLDLPYPGGPEIERVAREGKPTFPFKAGKIKADRYGFSFSGLKTAALYAIKGKMGSKRDDTILTEWEKSDVASSFQEAAFNDVIAKAVLASQEYGAQAIVLGGGVTQNRHLRALFKRCTSLPLLWPGKGLSLDNGAMIAALGHHVYQRKGPDTMDREPHPRKPFYAEKSTTSIPAHTQ